MNIDKRIILTLSAAILLTGCGKERKEKKTAPVNVKTVTVGESGEATRRTYIGTVKEATGASLSFSTAGTVKKVLADEGQAVNAGQLLATLDDTQAMNAYAIAKATLSQTEDAFRRMNELYDKGSLAEVKYVDIQTKLAEARSSERIARKMLDDCRLTAPFAGYIARRSVDAGSNVLPGASCFSLIKLNPVDVTFPVPEQERSVMRQGAKVTVTVGALGGRHYQGVVMREGVSADRLSHTYEMAARVMNNDKRLLPGMVCDVTADIRESNDSNVIIPQEAVLTDGQRQIIWLCEKGKARRRVVTTQGVTADGVIVSGGLRKGERLIVEGQNKVSEGQTVKEQDNNP